VTACNRQACPTRTHASVHALKQGETPDKKPVKTRGNAKGILSGCKRPSFRAQKVTSCNVKGHLLQTRRFSLENQRTSNSRPPPHPTKRKLSPFYFAQSKFCTIFAVKNKQKQQNGK